MPKPQVILLTGDCEGCGAPGGLYVPSLDQYHCPECSRAHIRYRAAWRSLEELTAALYDAWAKHWRAQGLPDLEVREIREYVGRGDKVPR